MPAKPQVKDLARYAINTLIHRLENKILDIPDSILINDLWYARLSPEMPDNLSELFRGVVINIEDQDDIVKPILMVLTNRLKTSNAKTRKNKATETINPVVDEIMPETATVIEDTTKAKPIAKSTTGKAK